MSFAPQTTPRPPVLFDRSACGRIRLTGSDRARFLHNQTTNNIEQLAAGQGCYTVFVSSTGRTLDLATTYVFPDSLLVIVSPGMAEKLYGWMDRYIFFSDQVTLTDESEQTFLFTIFGAGADAAIQQLGVAFAHEKQQFSHQTISLPSSLADVAAQITVAVGSDLGSSGPKGLENPEGLEGYTIVGPKSQADTVWKALLAAGLTAGSTEQWEALRIQQGRPAPGKELTDDDNPLEAGLWQGISFEKGCYIGQETIARLNTYKGVKKRLWGIKLSGATADSDMLLGATLLAEGAKIGKITSLSEINGELLGLCYLRTKAGGEGLNVAIQNPEQSTEQNPEQNPDTPLSSDEMISGEIIALPFISHEYPADRPVDKHE